MKIHAEVRDSITDDREGFEMSGEWESEGIAGVFALKGPRSGAGCQIGSALRCQSGGRIE